MMDYISKKVYQDRIYNFLDSDNEDDRVLLLNGEWGVGKTYLLQNYIQSDSLKCFEYAFISLFGLNSIDDLKKEFVIKSDKWFKFKNSIKKIASAFSVSGGNEYFGISLSIGDLIAGFDNDSSKKIKDAKNRVLIIEDVERKNTQLNICDIIDFINELNFFNLKIIFVCNEEQYLERDTSPEYLYKKEKIISTVIKLERPTREAVSEVFEEHDNLIPIVEELDCKNLRICKRFINVVKGLGIKENEDVYSNYYKLILGALMNIHANKYGEDYYVAKELEESHDKHKYFPDTLEKDEDVIERAKKEAEGNSEYNSFCISARHIIGDKTGLSDEAKSIYSKLKNCEPLSKSDLSNKSILCVENYLLDPSEAIYSNNIGKNIDEQIKKARKIVGQDDYVDADIYKSIVIFLSYYSDAAGLIDDVSKKKLNTLKNKCVNGALTSFLMRKFDFDLGMDLLTSSRPNYQSYIIEERISFFSATIDKFFKLYNSNGVDIEAFGNLLDKGYAMKTVLDQRNDSKGKEMDVSMKNAVLRLCKTIVNECFD